MARVSKFSRVKVNRVSVKRTVSQVHVLNYRII